MNNLPPNNQPSWDVLLVGGPSGTGKTRVSRQLARHFGVGLAEVDDFHTVLATMTTPEQQPILHYWKTNPEAHNLSAEQILDLHISVGRVLLPAISAVIADHIEFQLPLILEGDYLLPELIAQNVENNLFPADRVRAVFLYEPDERQIVNNFSQRESDEGEQTGRAHVSWLYGEWLKQECARYNIAILPAMPWATLFDRIVAAIK